MSLREEKNPNSENRTLGCAAAGRCVLGNMEPSCFVFSCPINLRFCDLQCILDHSLYKPNMLRKCLSNKAEEHPSAADTSSFAAALRRKKKLRPPRPLVRFGKEAKQLASAGGGAGADLGADGKRFHRKLSLLISRLPTPGGAQPPLAAAPRPPRNPPLTSSRSPANHRRLAVQL